MDKCGILLSISPFKLFFLAQYLCVDFDTSCLFTCIAKDPFCDKKRSWKDHDIIYFESLLIIVVRNWIHLNLSCVVFHCKMDSN